MRKFVRAFMQVMTVVLLLLILAATVPVKDGTIDEHALKVRCFSWLETAKHKLTNVQKSLDVEPEPELELAPPPRPVTKPEMSPPPRTVTKQGPPPPMGPMPK